MRRVFLSALAGLLLLPSLAGAVSLVNGSLTGPIANNGVPPGWSILGGSPDTMDENNNVGVGTPFGIPPIGPSPDGGTWVGFAREGLGFVESFGQTISDFTVGQSYTLSWYAGNFGAQTGPGYVAPNAIEVLLSGAVVGSGALLPLGRIWYAEQISFVATAMSHQLAFRLRDNPAAYLSIDGISLQPSRVPLPAPILLLGAALGGLALVRRRA